MHPHINEVFYTGKHFQPRPMFVVGDQSSLARKAWTRNINLNVDHLVCHLTAGQNVLRLPNHLPYFCQHFLNVECLNY